MQTNDASVAGRRGYSKRRIDRVLGAMAMLALATAAPLQAQSVNSQMTVGGPAAPPATHRPPHYPHYPYGLVLPTAPRTVRCEQDRLLTDTRPCTEEALVPLPIAPRTKPRCVESGAVPVATPCEE